MYKGYGAASACLKRGAKVRCDGVFYAAGRHIFVAAGTCSSVGKVGLISPIGSIKLWVSRERLMNAQLMPVPFRDDTVVLLGRDNEPYVAMRPIVENMGLAWSPQRTKLAERFGPVVTEIVTTGVDGKQYAMSCLPLRKLAGWLYTINPKKVAPELRDKIIQYQEECDEVLWRYWTKDQKQYVAQLEERAARILPLPGVTRSARDGINFKQLLILQEQARDLAKLLDAATGSFERHGLHNQLRQVNDALGLPTPPLEPSPLPLH